MEKLKAKLKKQGGFTMVELLIVVAIIAILVAVSIPMMNSTLEKSRHAVDQANERDAIALAATKILADEVNWGTGDSVTYYYHVDNQHIGSLDETGPGVDSQCTCSPGGTTAANGIGDNKTLSVTITKATGTDKNPTFVVNWSDKSGT